jgi:hypothetical protein
MLFDAMWGLLFQAIGLLTVAHFIMKWLNSGLASVRGTCLRFVGRADLAVTLEPLDVKTGTFYEHGIEYKRAAKGAPLLIVKPKGKQCNAEGQLIKEDFEYIEARPDIMRMRLETIMPNSKFLPLARLTKFQVAIRDETDILGYGFRAGDLLFTARHIFDEHGLAGKFVAGNLAAVPLAPLKWFTPLRKDVGGTGCDWIAILLSIDTWSRIAVASAKETNITFGSPKQARVGGFSRVHGSVQATGDVDYNMELNRVTGLMAHKISTVPGFSGAPLMTTNGTPKICGMHLKGASRYNFAMTGANIRSVLRRITAVDADRQVELSGGLESQDNSETSRESQSQYEDDYEVYEGDLDRYGAVDDFDLVSAERENRVHAAMSRYLDAQAMDTTYGGNDEGDYYSRRDADRRFERDFDLLESAPAKKTDVFAAACDKAFAGSGLPAAQKAWFKALYHYGHAGELVTAYGDQIRFWATCSDDKVPSPLPVFERREPTPAEVRAVLNGYSPADDYSFLAKVLSWKVDKATFIDIKDGDTYVFDALRQNRQHGEGEAYEGTVMADGRGRAFFKSYRKMAKSVKGKSKKQEPIPLSQDHRAILDKYGLVSEWVAPPDDKAAMLKSMQVQASAQEPGNLIMDEDNLRDFYKATAVHKRDPLEVQSPMAAFNTVGMALKDTSSGWSSFNHNLTKAAFFKHKSDDLRRLVFQRHLMRLALWDQLPTMTAAECFHAGVADPKQIFVKDEPHGARKIAKEKWRLIWICSLVDIMVSGMLNMRYHKRQIESYQAGDNNHVCAGLGHDDRGISRLGEVIEHISDGSGVVHTQDASGWDLGVSSGHWIYAAATQAQAMDHKDVIADLVYRAMLHADYYATMKHLLLVGDELWECQVYGPMPSGSDKTTAVNNRARQAGLIQAGAKRAATAGDDAITKEVPSADLLRLQGTNPRDEETHNISDKVPFTSHQFTVKGSGAVGCTFNNLSKSVARLLLKGGQPKSEAIGGVCYACRNTSDALKVFLDVCQHYAWTVPSPDEWKPEDNDI